MIATILLVAVSVIALISLMEATRRRPAIPVGDIRCFFKVIAGNAHRNRDVDRKLSKQLPT